MAVSILVLNEDGSPTAYTALANIVRRICQLICPGVPTQHLQFTPTPVELESCVRANLWKSRRPRDHRIQVDLARTIATQLATEPGFVAFHYDGDTTWQNRTACPHDAQFEDNVRDRVRLLLATHVASDQIEARLTRLLVLKPFYCLEAWTYQNRAKARSLCAALGNPKGTEQLDAWDANPSLLDEIAQLPEQFPLGKHYNVELTAQAYPADDVYGLDRSFTASVNAALACAPFVAALTRLSKPSPV